MMKDRTYPRRGLHGELVHDIGLRIVRGELRPGDPLPTDADGDPGGSRTVVREAIKVLAAKGLVVSRPKTGTQVRPRRFWNLMDPDVLSWRIEADPGVEFFLEIFELRRVIEPAAAALAASRATAEEVAELEAAFTEMEANAVESPETYIAADLRFHEIILEACHNELLGQLGSTLRAVFRASFTRTHGTAVQTMGLHGRVLAGIRDGDGAAAEAAMLELISTTASLLRESEDAAVPAPTGR
jgi:GntR family transcriptional regulator, galactonate operon transcriptional repressor